MPNDFDVKVEGLKELKDRLNYLSYDMQYKGGRFALRKAANVIRDQAKENAERIDRAETSNSIADNIAVRFGSRQTKRTGDITFRVGVLGGAKKSETLAGKYKGGDTWYWRLVEFGTEHSRANPFMRPAIEASAQRATNEFINQYNRALDRAIKRAKAGK